MHNFVKKSQILLKKIDASVGETNMFDEELNEISEQLKVITSILIILFRLQKKILYKS